MGCVIHRLFPINGRAEFSTGRVRETPHPPKRRERFLHGVCKTETPPDKRPVSSFGRCGVPLTRPVLESVSSFGGWGMSVTSTRDQFCLVVCRVGSLSHTHRAGLCLVLLVSGEFLQHAPCWNLSDRSTVWESLFYTPCWNLSRRFGRWGASLTRPMLESVSSFGGCGISITKSLLGSVFSFGARGLSLTRPVLEWVSSFGGWGVSLTRPVLESVSSVGGWGVFVTFLRAKKCPVVCRVGNLSSTHRAGICLVVLVSGKFLLHTRYWRL